MGNTVALKISHIQEVVTKEFEEVSKDAINEKFGIFKIKTGNAWIEESKERPVPNTLWEHKLWFQFETCILFADTNAGKSILAVQMGLDIATTKRLRVLFFDFELSDKQFELRYSQEYTNHYHFPDNFFRAEIDIDSINENTNLEDAIIQSIETALIQLDCKILIIDNITYLKNETDKAKNALPLMKALKILKTKYQLSILVLAHTPKRDMTRPITPNDLQGSKMLMNFCDSAFAIGQSSQDNSLRYIKQIKERNTPKILHANNVAIYRITKESNLLFMVFTCYSTEREHLKEKKAYDKDELKERVNELNGKGRSQREIATQLSIGLGTVNKYINK
jgi:DNA-binding NarL/FixJ family response regulator